MEKTKKEQGHPEIQVKIKFLKRLPQNDLGTCNRVRRKASEFEICISEQANRTLAEFGSTLLHELLHLWVFLMANYGYKVGLAREHKFIYAVENVVIKFMEIFLKEKTT